MKITTFSSYLLLIISIFILTYHVNAQDNFRISLKPVDAQLDTISKTPMLTGPSVLMEENKLIWGGSVIKGEDGMYHMFFSTWNSEPGNLTFSNSWVLHSEIGYAISKYPDKKFKIQQIVLRGRKYDGDSTAWDAQMVHNPHIKRFNHKYYLYYIGSYDPGKQPEGSPGESLNKRNRVQQVQRIGVIEFEKFSDLLNGNFKRPERPLLSPRTRVKKRDVVNPSPQGTITKPDNITVVNPSVTYRPSDKKYLLYFKGNWYDPQWRGVHGVAVSDTPTGPFKTLDAIIFDIRMPDGRIASAEDPYVWYYKKYNCFYAVVKDFSGELTGNEPGLALLKSQDGIHWKKPGSPTYIKKEVVLKVGSKLKLAHLERPQLLLDTNGTPLVLYAACSVVPVFNLINTGSFNIQIPLFIED